MNWSEQNVELIGEPASIDTPIKEGVSQLFSEDCGELEMETRRVLVQLLMGPSLDARRHSKLWQTLLRDEMIIRCRLSELFLELIMDRDSQIAFTRQANTEDLDIPILLRRAQLTYIDSILLLYLRQRLTQAEAQSERAVVSIPEIIEHLVLFERDNNTDRAGFQKRIYASIEKMKKHNILQKIRSSEDRLEISSILKLLFSAEEILTLTRLYQKMLTDDERGVQE